MKIHCLLLKRQLIQLQDELRFLLKEVSGHSCDEMMRLAACLERKVAQVEKTLTSFGRNGEVKIGVFQDRALVRSLKLDVRFARAKWQCYLMKLARAT